MESIYLGRFSRRWIGKKVELGKYFQNYSKALSFAYGPEKKSSILQLVLQLLPENISLDKKDFANLIRSTNPKLLKPVHSIAKRKNVNRSKPTKNKYLRAHAKNSLTKNKSCGQKEDATKKSISDYESVDIESEMLNSKAENEETMLRNAELHQTDSTSSVAELDGADNIEIRIPKIIEKENVVCEDIEFVSVDTLDGMDNIKKQKTSKREPLNIYAKQSSMVGTAMSKRNNLKPGKDFLVSFRIHDPFHCHEGRLVGTFIQEILLLGRQTLGNLRDKIICPSDFQDIQGDLSEAPDTPIKRLTRDVYRSAMFYFDNTFYVDSREREDYSKVIQDWARPRGIPVGRTFDMHLKLVSQLQVRFGYPYVYVHQGCCEHLVIINDARWIVSDNDRLPHDIMHMCKTCFKMFNYSGNVKCGKFKAYRLFQRAVLL